MDIDHLEVEIGADIDEFNRKIDKVQRRIATFRDSNGRLRDQFGKFMPEFGGGGGFGGSFLKTLSGGLQSAGWQDFAIKMAAIDVILPTIISSIGLLAGGVAALASQFTAATAGIAGFAAVAIPAFTSLKKVQGEIAAAEKAIKDAETAEEKAEAIKRLEEIYKGLSEAQKDALKGMEDFGEFWEQFTKKFETPVFEAFAISMGIAKDVLKELEPMIRSVSDTIVGLMQSLQENLQSKDVQEFFKFLNETAAPAIDNLTKGVGNFIVGFGSMMEAFGPLGEDFSEGFLDMSEDFRKWADDIENNKSFQKFVEWVRENGPDLIDDLGVIAEYLLDVAVALAQTGDSIIDFLADLARLQKDFQETMEDLGNIIEDIDWSEAMKEIGEHVISGLIGGMDSKIDELRDKAAEIGRIVANAARSALGIRSPSRVFKEIGGYVGDGLSIGMNDSVGNIEQSSRSLAMASQRGFVQPSSPNNGSSDIMSALENMILDNRIEIDGQEVVRVIGKPMMRFMGKESKAASRRVGLG